MNRTRSLIVAAGVFAGSAWSLAADDVDLQVRGNELIDGTLRPAAERETFIVDAPLGATITASVKLVGVGGPVPGIDLLDGGSVLITQATASATGAKLNKHAVTKSDLLRLRVAGDGALDGDYQFKVKMTTRRAWGERAAAPLAAGATAQSKFAAGAGATADVALAPDKGSAFGARIVSIDGPSGFHLDVDDSGVYGTRHRIARVPLGAAGDYTVQLRNDGAAAGAWVIGVKLAVQKVSKTTVNIADSALTGAFGDDATVFGRIVNPAGALIDPPDTGGPLDGASVSVPPGAMATPTVIAIQSSQTFFVDDTNHAAGIAISLTPSGTRFATPVTVTVPFDPQSFDDPLNELSIYIENTETGELEAVPRSLLVIDTVGNTVSFPTSHFSRFQGTSPRPRAVKGTFVQLEIGGTAIGGFGGNIVFGLTRVNALKGARTGNGFSRDLDRRGMVFGPTELGYFNSKGATDFGTLDVESDQVVTMQSTNDGPIRLVRGRAADVLIQPPGALGQGPSASVLLRIAKGAATPANLAGDWNAEIFEFVGSHDAGGAVVLETTGQNLRMRFGLDGSVVASNVATHVVSAGATGTWQVREDFTPPAPGVLTIAQGRLSLSMQLGNSKLITEMPLVPVLSGDALVGVADAFTGSEKTSDAVALRMIVLVRVPVIAGPLALAGTSLFSSFGLVPIDRAGASQDLRFTAEDVFAQRDGVRALTVRGQRLTQGHDANGDPVSASVPVDDVGTYTVGRDGVYREFSPPGLGAVAPRSGFYVTTRFVGPLLSIGFGVVAPPKN